MRLLFIHYPKIEKVVRFLGVTDVIDAFVGVVAARA